uniref:Uncharacterized protein n=1 Tax=Podarcis muralis TaxID=64176 RepID=A0A670JRB1_PODMU
SSFPENATQLPSQSRCDPIRCTLNAWYPLQALQSPLKASSSCSSTCRFGGAGCPLLLTSGKEDKILAVAKVHQSQKRPLFSLDVYTDRITCPLHMKSAFLLAGTVKVSHHQLE